MTKNILAVAAILTLCSGSLRGQTSPAIEGVWRAVERTITDPNGESDGFGPGTHSNLQTEILIFTATHYSLIADTASKPRPPARLKVPGQPTRDELLSRYGPFTANAGTYEVSGNTLTRHVMVAKNPATQGSSGRSMFRLEGNNLWLTYVGSYGGTSQYPATVKYVRVE